MTSCPNPSLVPMTPSAVIKLAKARIVSLFNERERLIKQAKQELATWKKYRKDSFWSKPRTLTEEEVEQVFDFWKKKGYFPPERKHEDSLFYSLHIEEDLGLIRVVHITKTHIPNMTKLMDAARLVAHGCDMYLDVETASLLSNYAREQTDE